MKWQFPPLETIILHLDTCFIGKYVYHVKVTYYIEKPTKGNQLCWIR